MANERRKLTDTSDDFMSEGMVYGGLVGGVFFIFCAITGHVSAGAVCIFIGVAAGMLLGMSIKKEQKLSEAEREKEKAIATYKKLDQERNAFFPDLSVKPYNPRIKKPMLRTRIANGEQMAGFMDIVTGRFEEVMIIATEDDLEEFMRRYGIKSRSEISSL